MVGGYIPIIITADVSPPRKPVEFTTTSPRGWRACVIESWSARAVTFVLVYDAPRDEDDDDDNNKDGLDDGREEPYIIVWTRDDYRTRPKGAAAAGKPLKAVAYFYFTCVW